MQFSSESIINQFLRTYPGVFSVEIIKMFMAHQGIDIDDYDCQDFLDTSPFVFSLQDGMYMTRSGAFTGKLFSFKPTQEEIKNRVFIPGHRFMPFANPELLSCSLCCFLDGKKLKQKVIEVDSSFATKLFLLFGEEYSSQYIASDPANKDINLADLEFELPPKVKLTGISLDSILKNYDFQYGDRILCEQTDWDNGHFKIYPLIIHNHDLSMKNSDVHRQEWNDILEKAFMHEFDAMGPCASMEEQIANVFFEYMNYLSVRDCGSLEEFLLKTKKVGFECYGVETRIWFKGKDVPAIGNWNSIDGTDSNLANNSLFSLECLIDLFIKDNLYQKKDGTDGILENLKAFPISPECQEDLQKLIQKRYLLIKPKYNWFADFVLGAVRHSGLKLYQKISTLIHDVENNGENLLNFPQQELVILTQLYVHLTKILDSAENDPAYICAESEAVMLSLEGMEYNFEEIKPLLCAAVKEQYKKGFKIIK